MTFSYMVHKLLVRQSCFFSFTRWLYYRHVGVRFRLIIRLCGNAKQTDRSLDRRVWSVHNMHLLLNDGTFIRMYCTYIHTRVCY